LLINKKAAKGSGCWKLAVSLECRRCWEMHHWSRRFSAFSSWLRKYELLELFTSLSVTQQWQRYHCLPSSSPDLFHCPSNWRWSRFACDASDKSHL